MSVVSPFSLQTLQIKQPGQSSYASKLDPVTYVTYNMLLVQLALLD